MSAHDHSVWNNGLFLHASSVVVPSGALLFLGNSGAGKSTICQLLSKSFPMLADDFVFVQRNADGTWYVSDGTPRMFGRQPLGKESDCNGKIPLRSVLRIFQARTVQLQTISPLDACRHLMDAALEIKYQQIQTNRLLKQTWFTYVADISRRYPGWRLRFNLTSDTLELIREKFFGKTAAKNSIHGIERREHYAR